MSSDNIDSVEMFFGNGTVYVTDRNRVRAFEEYNFNIESLQPKSHGEYWVTEEVIVALGCDVSPKRALKVLRHVVQRIESEMARRGVTNERASSHGYLSARSSITFLNRSPGGPPRPDSHNLALHVRCAIPLGGDDLSLLKRGALMRI